MGLEVIQFGSNPPPTLPIAEGSALRWTLSSRLDVNDEQDSLRAGVLRIPPTVLLTSTWYAVLRLGEPIVGW